MSAWRYLTADQIVSRRPCKLLSVLISTDGAGPGKVEIYDGEEAFSDRKVATLLTAGDNARHFHWRGLELEHGLYVDFVEKADYVTVEFEYS
jgi:hypothetical protein